MGLCFGSVPSKTMRELHPLITRHLSGAHLSSDPRKQMILCPHPRESEATSISSKMADSLGVLRWHQAS